MLAFRIMAWGQIFSFWLLTIFILALPGPDWAFIIASGTSGKKLVSAISGLLAGYWLVIALVAFGVAAVVAKLPVVLDLLTIVGALYLLYLGQGLIRNPASFDSAHDRESFAPRALFAKGFGVSGLNPKGLLFFLVLLPQFTKTGEAWPIFIQILMLGVVFTISFVPFYLSLGVVTLKVLTRKPHHIRTVSRVSGIAMVLLGIGLAWQRFIH